MTFTGQARGYKGQTMIDFETTFKTAPTTKKGKIMPMIQNQVKASQTLNDSGIIKGTRNASEPFQGNESVDGDVDIPLDYRAIGYWFKGMLGNTTTKAAAKEGMYEHTFKVGDTQPSMVIQKAFLDIGKYFIYNGCKVGSFKMSFGGDAEATATVSIVGAKETTQTATYDASAATVAEEVASQFQGTIKEAGAAIISIVKSGDITMDMGLDTDQYCVGDNGTRGDIPEGLIAISGTMSALFKDMTFVDKAKNGTKSSFELVYTKGDYKLSLLFPEIVYERTSPTITGKSGVLCDCNWKAFWRDDSNASAVVVTLTNDIASY